MGDSKRQRVGLLVFVAVCFILTAAFLQTLGLVLAQCVCIWAAMVVVHNAIKACVIADQGKQVDRETDE
jgi:hypothetical protein